MNDNEWKYLLEAQRSLGGEGAMPPEMRSHEQLEAVLSMAEGYVSTATIIADHRARELPFWRRKEIKERFVKVAREKAAQIVADTRLWMDKDFFMLARSAAPDNILAAIGRGADVNARNDRGWTPLMCAAGFNDSPEPIRALIEAGAQVNARVEYEPMMLIHYAANVSPETKLIDKSNCWTPLMCAAVFNKNYRVLHVLLAAGADIAARDNCGRTPSKVFPLDISQSSSGRTVLMLAGEHTTSPEVDVDRGGRRRARSR